MNKFINWIISSLKYISRKNNLFLMEFYKNILFLINKNSTLSKIYKPIVSEKISTNKYLQEVLKALKHKNSESQNNIFKLENKNKLIQSKISTIQDIITKRYD